jgi:hypothetical protein
MMPPRDCAETPVFLSSTSSVRNKFKGNKKDMKLFYNLSQSKTKEYLLN